MRFCDFFLDYKIQLKNIKTLIPWTVLPRYRKIFIIITFIAYVVQKVAEPATVEELLNIALSTIIIIICAASIAISLGPILNDLLYRDKQKYDYLIYDLRQLKIFKAQDSPQNS